MQLLINFNNHDEADYKESFILGCKYDWAAGLCVDRDVEDGSRGCAAFFEDRMNEKLYPQGIILFGSILLEGFTVFAACFYCWKRNPEKKNAEACLKRPIFFNVGLGTSRSRRATRRSPPPPRPPGTPVT